MAYFLHQSPWWVHRFETLSNHFLELVVPFFIFLGRRMCILHGTLQILFQVSHCRPCEYEHGLSVSRKTLSGSKVAVSCLLFVFITGNLHAVTAVPS